jgi:hypothetical protein
MGLLHELDDGRKREITEADYQYFLEVLPPVAFRFQWNGERWGFGFVEGNDYVYAFKQETGKFYAQKTDLLNPIECGVPLDKQLQGFSKRLKVEKEANRAASWISIWLRLGKQNPWIRQASDPPFNTQSFHACLSDDELLDKFEQSNWCIGQAFYRGDLCFIQQSVDAGGEWLAIKQDVPFESISFGRIMCGPRRSRRCPA